MNTSQFEEWFAYHVGAFPGLGPWMAEHQATLPHWQNALQDLSLDDAKGATDAMVRGDIPEPKGYTGHPKAIRSGCGKDARTFTDTPVPQLIDGNLCFNCATCEDSGWVSVFHPEAQRTIWRERYLNRDQRKTCDVPCSCDAGDKYYYSKLKKNPEAFRFDPQRMFQVESSLPSDLECEALLAFLEAREAKGPKRDADTGGIEFGSTL